MISALVACALGAIILAFGYLAGVLAGMSAIKDGLLKEGFYLDKYTSKDPGHGFYVLYRRTVEGKWAEIKNIE